jgi:hypothetical protein
MRVRIQDATPVDSRYLTLSSAFFHNLPYSTVTVLMLMLGFQVPLHIYQADMYRY